MPEYLCDTGILILCLRGDEQAIALWDSLSTAGQIHISAVTYLEVIAGMQSWEESDTYDVLMSCMCHSLDEAIADQAGRLIARYRAQGVAIGVPDAVIAATALIHSLTLVTYNRKHFPMRELSFYPV